jgi:pimeloyl-ACP methyl ester carboxylesterase
VQEKFQPYFADAGYDSWAVSLRGQGGSDPVVGASVAGRVASATSTVCRDFADVSRVTFLFELQLSLGSGVVTLVKALLPLVTAAHMYVCAGTLDSHAQDLAEVVQELGTAPVMVAHSFGGLIAQK